MPVPYYPGSLVTPNFGLSLVGMEAELAENFVIIDSALGGGSGTGNISGTLTPGTIPFATGIHAISDGSLTDDGAGSIGLNSAITTGLEIFLGVGQGAFAIVTNDQILLDNGASGTTFGLGSDAYIQASLFRILGPTLTHGDVTVGENTAGTYSLIFEGKTSGQAAISVPDAAGTPNKLLLPTTTGTNGQALITDGGNPQQLSWATIGSGVPGGSDTQIQFNDGGSFGGATGLTWNKSTSVFSVNGKILGQNGGTGVAQGTFEFMGTGSGTVHGSPTLFDIVQQTSSDWGLTIRNAVAGTVGGFFVFVDESGNAILGCGNDLCDLELDADGSLGLFSTEDGFIMNNDSTFEFLGGAASPVLILDGFTSGSAAISVAAIAGTPNTLLLPTSTGTSGYVLSTDGANPQQLSWVPQSGGSSITVRNKTANYNAVVGDVIFCDTSAGGFTITIPTATSSVNGEITVKKVSSDGNTLTVASAASDNFDQQATLSIVAQDTSVTLVSNGATSANWYII